MNDIFDAIPVPHDRVRLGDLAIDSSDPRLERVSLQKRTERHQRLSFVSRHIRKEKE
jgi:hypothetical protein